MTDYHSVIENNCTQSAVPWWPRCAFHYTDISNAVSILDCGYLYPRSVAVKSGMMQNDNASSQVIHVTVSGAQECVRFYFRPLTPTQYYNEGFKHPALRYSENGNDANVPVPVFFLFDLEKVLNRDETEFTDGSEAGTGSNSYHSAEDFERLNFELIYSNGKVTEEVKRWRQAEILFHGAFPIDFALKRIVLRNDVERNTFLRMLKQKNISIYKKYLPCIRVNNSDIFYNNGSYIRDIQYLDGDLNVQLNDSFAKDYFTRRQMEKYHLSSLTSLDASAEFEWLKDGRLCAGSRSDFSFSYDKRSLLTFKSDKHLNEADTLRVRLYFGKDKAKRLMCDVDVPMKKSEIL